MQLANTDDIGGAQRPKIPRSNVNFGAAGRPFLIRRQRETRVGLVLSKVPKCEQRKGRTIL